MCHNTTIVHRCGQHTGREITYCRNAGRSRTTGKKTMCGNRSATRTNQRDSLCSEPTCRHRQLGGSWTCCMCDNGPNRYGRCVFTRVISPGSGHVINPCKHSPCDECTSYRRR
ncbi:uncharacterized protein BKA55DRAFT_624024 [Fusarium redolens]|uniref:Uncharacterized protein n=1 Tax=Fusarium redolens TaxID=48865 RepID=A0A9P9G831_FUSRE|nr:uncharacterized protein BKA55DRAFT_624024 [Fusarium redolens]KAH7233765.1 hypothetical protein BKA55DRAFT_624024 [Fusarium redolens]